LYAYVPDVNDTVTKGLLDFIEARPELAMATNEPGTARAAGTAAAPEALIDLHPGNSIPTLTMRFEAPEDWDPASPGTQRAFGTTVHAAIAATRTAEDLPKVLQRAVITGDLSAAEAQQLLAQLAPMIATPALAPWFTADLDVRAEAALITADGKSIRPDRMVVDGDRVRVLEIKTGKPSPTHEEQVRTYLALLRELGHTQVEGAVWYLTNGELRPVA
jgi:hypothetical protein